MPLPWKKNKVSRISRFMADLQSPPKRGGSLVVETGFPTSLVDLFVKNRDRLKKRTKKKSQSQPQLEISNPMMVTPPPPCYNNNRTVNLSSGFERIVPRNEIKISPLQQLALIKDCDGDHGGGGDGSKKRKVLLAVLRVFFVVLLALSNKRLAFGITKSAFLLLLLEYVGTRVLRYLMPCSKASTVFYSFIDKVKIISFFNWQKDVVSEEIERCGEYSTKACNNDVCDCSVEEIQVLDSYGVGVIHVEEIRNKETDLEPVTGDGGGLNLDLEIKERIQHRENVEKVDVLVSKKEQSRRAKIRSTLVKKLVPKKMRNSKKGKQTKEMETEPSCENHRCLGEDNLARIHRPEDQHKQGPDCEDELSQCRQDESENGTTTQSQTETEVSIEETVKMEGKGNSGYIILCLIVLAGLVGGRVLALVLTVAWCLVLKLARRLRPVTISS